MSNYKIIMTGGGTAGHVTPNLALVPKLKEKGFDIIYFNFNLAFALNSALFALSISIRSSLLFNLSFALFKASSARFTSISSGKLRRYFDMKNFTDPFKVIKGIAQANKILAKEKPDVIFSKGGFVAVPVVIAASMKKIPVVSHESDLTPGLANKLSAPFCDKLCDKAKQASCFEQRRFHFDKDMGRSYQGCRYGKIS